jgi:hypothetical protein
VTKIEELEKEIEILKLKIAVLEARQPVIQWYPYYVYPTYIPPVYPSFPNPWWNQPYYGGIGMGLSGDCSSLGSNSITYQGA